jgi:hypothetical protein
MVQVAFAVVMAREGALDRAVSETSNREGRAR